MRNIKLGERLREKSKSISRTLQYFIDKLIDMNDKLTRTHDNLVMDELDIIVERELINLEIEKNSDLILKLKEL